MFPLKKVLVAYWHRRRDSSELESTSRTAHYAHAVHIRPLTTSYLFVLPPLTGRLQLPSEKQIRFGHHFKRNHNINNLLNAQRE